MKKKAKEKVRSNSPTSTMEDYLEVMVNLEKEKKALRVKDIAKRMQVSMPTVTSMLKNLAQAGLVEYERYEYIELTEKGREIGEEINRRHQSLKRFLTEILGVDSKIAEQEACKMEHTISAATVDRFVEFMEFIEFCPRAGRKWLEYFQQYRKYGKNKASCIKYMKEFEEFFKKYIKETMNEG